MSCCGGCGPTTAGPRWRCAGAGTVRSWNRSDDIAELFALAGAVAARLGVELRETSVGGASDGNFVAARGCRCWTGWVRSAEARTPGTST